MDKFDEHEVCPACGNDPVESGLKWKPKFIPTSGGYRIVRVASDRDVVESSGGEIVKAHLLVSCGQCKYQMKRGCLSEV